MRTALIPLVLAIACSPAEPLGPSEPGGDPGVPPTEEPTTPPEPCEGLRIESLATDDPAWAELGDGDPVEVVWGDQGGWHLDLGAVVYSEVQAVELDVKVYAGGELIAGEQPAYYAALAGWDEESCTGTVTDQLFVDDFLPPTTYQAFVCSLAQQELEVEVTVSTLEGPLLTTTHVGHPVAVHGPHEQEACH